MLIFWETFGPIKLQTWGNFASEMGALFLPSISVGFEMVRFTSSSFTNDIRTYIIAADKSEFHTPRLNASWLTVEITKLFGEHMKNS